MNELPESLKIKSEALEPAFQHLIGHWYAQCEHMKKTYGKDSYAYVDAMQNWWWGMRKISSLLVACPGQAQHAQIAISNHMQDIKRMIERELDIEFSFMDGDDLNFRNLVKIPLKLSM